MENIVFILSISSLLACGGLLLTSALHSAPEPAIIPLETLFGNPVKTNPSLSPDGRRLAYLAPVHNVLNVWVKTIGKEDDRVITHDTGRGIRRYFWAEDNQHVLYLQDKEGDENWLLFGVHLSSGTIKAYTPFEKVQVHIVEVNKNYPQELLISMNKENEKVHDVYHLNIASGELKLIVKNPGNISSWLSDAQLRVRAATVETDDGGSELLVRDTEQTPWKKILVWSQEDSLTSRVVSFNKEGTELYLVNSQNANTSRLVRLDLRSLKQKPIAADPLYDVSEVVIHPDTYHVQAVAFTKERHVWKVIDKGIQADYKKITKLQRGDFSIISRSNDDAQWVIAFVVDNGPAAFYLYDRKKKRASLLFYSKPALKEYDLCTMEPIMFRSRDGLTIHGYITFPAGSARQRLPMVVNVHGGPWSRDTWGYDPEAQWLANRGNICLQVNFRGSSGYGKDFLNAGDKEWGGKMHDDIVDAVDWAVKKGYADPKRIAIYGGSYGGYAALVGATFTPDLFRCAVDVVGPSNLITFIHSIPPYWSTFLASLYKRVGNPQTEEEFLKSRSPLFKVSNIKIPMLIAQGANDPRVKQAESEQIVAELKRKGIDYEYLLFPDEGHGFAKPENRIRFYKAAERFLSKQLSGRVQK